MLIKKIMAFLVQEILTNIINGLEVKFYSLVENGSIEVPLFLISDVLS